MDDADVAEHMQPVIEDGFVLNDKRFERLKQWHAVLFQLMSARSYLHQIMTRERLLGDLSDALTDLSLLAAFVLQYSKCFTSGGTGQARLDEKKVFDADSDALKAHTRILDIRHRFVAHNDNTDLVVSNLAVKELEDRFVVRHLMTYAMPGNEYPDFQAALDVVEQHVIEAMNKNLDSLGERLGKVITLHQD
jgi:hypothetical protein